MRILVVLLTVVSAVAIAGCSGAVTGEVSSRTGKTPLPAATVKIGNQQVVTDTSGRFTIDKVATGSTAVSVQAEGFGPYKGSLDVKKGENTVNVALEDGSLTVRIKENAEVREPLKMAKVTIGDAAAVKAQGARFAAAGVPVGEQVLKVSCPGHAAAKKNVAIAPGENEVTIALDLTPTETYMRYYQAYRFGRYKEAWRFVHADVKKHMSYAHYVKDEKTQGQVVNIKFFGERAMAKWRPPFSKATYKHIVAIDRALQERDAWGSYTDNYTQHWQQIHGRWYIIFDWRD
jgi:Carboxypeptidase regulatory-like domain